MKYTLLNSIVKEIQLKLFEGEKGQQTGQIQKIYSSCRYLYFAIRFPGQTYSLYLGRGGGYEGLFLQEDKPLPPRLRVPDSFLNYLRKHLVNSFLIGINCDDKDRIITFDYQRKGQRNRLLFFWCGRKLYFAHSFFSHKKNIYLLYKSWSPKEIDFDQLADFDIFDEVGRKRIHKEGEAHQKCSSLDSLLEDELNDRRSKSPHMKKDDRKLKRRLKNIEKDLLKNSQWTQIEKLLSSVDWGKLDNLSEVKLENDKIKFPPALNSFQKKDYLFEKLKRLKRGEQISLKRLEETKKQLESKEKDIEYLSGQAISPQWKQVRDIEKNVAIAEKIDVQKITLLQNRFGYLGKNARGNDQLRNQIGHKDDWWFHLEGHRGAHFILKNGQLNDLGDLEWQIIGSALCDHSGKELIGIPLVYTQIKNLKSVRKSPGKVLLSKQKYRQVDYLPNWRHYLAHD